MKVQGDLISLSRGSGVDQADGARLTSEQVSGGSAPDGLDGPRQCRTPSPQRPRWRFSPHPSPSHSHPTGSMSSSSLDQSISRLQFYDLFDVALKEYNQKTGLDIVTDPLTATLLDCDSSGEVLNILREQAYAFSHYQNGDGAIRLMRHLKPTVDILLGLSSSGVFGKGFGLVRLMKSICSCECSSLPCRDIYQQR